MPMLSLVLDFIFPRRSLLGSAGMFITREEFAKLTPYPVRLESSVLKTMGLKYLDRVVAAGSYAGSPFLRRAIYTWKYGRIRGVGEELGKLLIRVFSLMGENSKFQAPNSKKIPNSKYQNSTIALCPVPLHWSREFYRGFNQAEQLAKILSNHTNIPVVHSLRRTHVTGFQARKHGVIRRGAMQGMFRCVSKPVPSRVILLDDILTTGATMEACAKELKVNGAVWVGGLVLAKG